MNEIDQNQQLAQSIQALTNALAASERRIQGMERLFRRLGMVVVLLMAMVLLPGLDAMFGTARASNPFLQGLGFSEQDLTHFSSILANLDAVLTMTNQAANTPEVKQAVADIFVLTGRLKQDSDVLRRGMVQASLAPDAFAALQKDQKAYDQAINQASPSQALFSLQQGIHRIQQGIQQEVRFLNGNIQAMVMAIDSTMGRFGRMMSPMPMPFGY
ncbi:MAG: hypothetical protein H7839_02975 [Magnetococcus sp. YQC-5]